MSVSAVNANTQVYSQDAAANTQSAAPPNKNQSAIPQDTVTISAAAKAQQTSSSGDVDHDGDSK